MDKTILTELHRFWFGELTSPTDQPAKDKSEIWFSRSEDTDRHCRERFGPHLDEARDADWDLTSLTREEQVALVVLLDQMPRNIFRDHGQAFAYDAKARTTARALVNNGLDRFYLCERLFLFMPFMHSEEVADQDYCALLLAEQALAVPDDNKETFRGGLDFATRHRDIIRKFGRFPHRNAALGRESTDDEKAFLAEKGRGY